MLSTKENEIKNNNETLNLSLNLSEINSEPQLPLQTNRIIEDQNDMIDVIPNKSFHSFAKNEIQKKENDLSSSTSSFSFQSPLGLATTETNYESLSSKFKSMVENQQQQNQLQQNQLQQNQLQQNQQFQNYERPYYLSQSLQSNFYQPTQQYQSVPPVDLSPISSRPVTPIRNKYKTGNDISLKNQKPKLQSLFPSNNYFSSSSLLSENMSLASTTKEKKKEKNQKSNHSQENNHYYNNSNDKSYVDKDDDDMDDDNDDNDSIHDKITDWTDDLEELMQFIRQNSIILYKYHLSRYYQYKRILPFFKIPVLILSAFNSVFSVGLQPYMKQSQISVLNCLVSLTITIINSIEMYMGIQKSMETEMIASQGFYLLSINIFKILKLERNHRENGGLLTLSEAFNNFQDLVKKSKLIHRQDIIDLLIPLESSVEKMLSNVSFIQSNAQISTPSSESLPSSKILSNSSNSSLLSSSPSQSSILPYFNSSKEKLSTPSSSNSYLFSSFVNKSTNVKPTENLNTFSFPNETQSSLYEGAPSSSILNDDISQAEKLLLKRLFERIEHRMNQDETTKEKEIT